MTPLRLDVIAHNRPEPFPPLQAGEPQEDFHSHYAQAPSQTAVAGSNANPAPPQATIKITRRHMRQGHHLQVLHRRLVEVQHLLRMLVVAADAQSRPAGDVPLRRLQLPHHELWPEPQTNHQGSTKNNESESA